MLLTQHYTCKLLHVINTTKKFEFSLQRHLFVLLRNSIHLLPVAPSRVEKLNYAKAIHMQAAWLVEGRSYRELFDWVGKCRGRRKREMESCFGLGWRHGRRFCPHHSRFIFYTIRILTSLIIIVNGWYYW